MLNKGEKKIWVLEFFTEDSNDLSKKLTHLKKVTFY